MYVSANICVVRDTPARLTGDVFGASVRALELSISARLDSAPSTPTPYNTLLSKKEEDHPDVFPVSTESDEDTGRERGRLLKFI